MNSGATIKDLIYMLISGRLAQEEIYLKRGTASNIDTGSWTCDVMPADGGADIKGVRLNVIDGGAGQGIIQVPADGSSVLVGFEGKTRAYIVAGEKLDSVVMRGGANGGLINISDLVDKLNALEDKINDLVTYSATHTHSGVTTGGGTSGTAVAPVVGSLTPTLVADIEDDKIKH